MGEETNAKCQKDCKCFRCSPLIGFDEDSSGDFPWTDSSDQHAKKVEGDIFARLYGFPLLPTRKEIYDARLARGEPGFTVQEIREQIERQKFKTFVRGFELEMAKAREIERINFLDYTIGGVVRGIIRFFRFLWTYRYYYKCHNKVAPIPPNKDPHHIIIHI